MKAEGNGPEARIAVLEGEISQLLQQTGDGIADLFEQMSQGNWRDDHGHDVKLNAAMINLKDVLRDIMVFRTLYLRYSPPGPR